MTMDRENWLILMEALGFAPNTETCDKLLSAHEARSRHYHTQDHLTACLRHLESVWDQARHPDEIAHAVLYEYSCINFS